MTAGHADAPLTALRKRYARSRRAGLAQQTQECADYLGHPEVLVSEFIDSYCMVDSWAGEGAAAARPLPAKPDDEEDEIVLEPFRPALEVVVAGGVETRFRCLAVNALPLAAAGPAPERDGLDYLGRACDPKAGAVLGAAQWRPDESAYLVFMRLLACLAEVAPEGQRRRLDRELCGGALGAAERIDLHLVLAGESGGREGESLSQLTRDLAEVFGRGLGEEVLFPPLLGEFVCLRMDPSGFDGRLEVAWRVRAERV